MPRKPEKTTAVKLTNEQIVHEIQQKTRKMAHHCAGIRYTKLPTALNKNKNLFNGPTKKKKKTKKDRTKKADSTGRIMKRLTVTEFMKLKKAAEKRAATGMRQKKKVTVNKRPTFTNFLHEIKSRQYHRM